MPTPKKPVVVKPEIEVGLGKTQDAFYAVPIHPPF